MYHFTADLHLGHENVLKFDPRPFDSIEAHDTAIIDNINALVRSKDTLVVVGDFAFVRGNKTDKYNATKAYRKRIHCEHVWLIRGNHDIPAIDDLFQLAHGKDGRIKYAKEHIIVNHYAMCVWNRSHFGSWHVHGHSHGRLNEWKDEHMPGAKSLDVGVNMHNYKPVSFDQLKEYMDARPGHQSMCHRSTTEKENQNADV